MRTLMGVLLAIETCRAKLQAALDGIGDPCPCGCQNEQVDLLEAQLKLLDEIMEGPQ